MARVIRSTASLLAAIALLAAGCGDEDKDGPAPQPTPAAAAPERDVDRYCALVDELDKAGDAVFEELERENASRRQFREAEQALVQQIGPKLDELEQVAPEEIARDVETLVASVRARAGEGPDVPRKDIAAAEERVEAYEEGNCPD